MAFGQHDGFGVVFKIATDTSTTVTTIGSLVDFNPTIDVGESDVSSTEDSDRWSSFLPARGNMTISGTVRFDPGSGEHEATMLDQLFLSRNWQLEWNDTGDTNDSKWSGTGFLTNISPTGAHDGPIDASFTLRVDASPTFTGVA